MKKTLVALVAAAALSACGGGGGGSGTSISVSPSSLSFTSTTAGSAPAAQAVQVNFDGDGLLIGFPPEVPQPSWLGVDILSESNSGADVRVSIVETDLPPGARSTTLRFVTGHSDGTAIKYKDVAISYTVTGDPLDASIEPSSGGGTAAQGGSLPAPLTLTVEHNGDWLEVPTMPSWLQLTETGSAAGSKTYRLDFTTTALSPGTYSDTLTFTARRPNGQRSVGYAVTYTVIAGLSVTPATSTYAHIKGADAEPTPANARSLTIASGNRSWVASSDQSWLVLGATEGTGGTLGFSIDRDLLDLGASVAHVTVDNLPTGESRSVTVTVNTRAPRLVVSPSAATATVDGLSTELVAQLSVTDEIGGSSDPVSWSVASVNVPWLAATPASGTTLPTATVDLKVVPAQLDSLANGQHAATVRLNYVNGDSNGYVDVPLTMTLAMPKVRYVAPYTAAAGVAGTVVVRGENLDTAPVDLVTIDGQGVTVTYVSPTELRLAHAGLAAGSHPVKAGNALGAQAPTKDLVALADPGYAYSAIDSPHRKKRLVPDFERGYIYVVDEEDRDLERYRQVAGAWVGERLTTPANVNDLALSPDGKTLVMLTDTHLLEADASQTPLTWVQKVQAGVNNSAYFYYGDLVMLNDGRVLVTSEDQWAWLYTYDLRTHQLADKVDFAWSVRLFGNRAGTMAAIHHGNCCTYRYDASTNGYQQAASSYYGPHIAVAPFGEKFVVGSYAVFNGDGSAMLGKVDGRMFSPSLTNAADRVYTWWNNPNIVSNGEIRAYDLTAATDLSGNFPVVQTVPMPVDVGAYYANDVSTFLNLQENTLFVFGNAKFAVMPLP